MLGECSAYAPKPREHLLSDLTSATGGSAIKAVEVLKEHNVPEDRIIFVNLVRMSIKCPASIPCLGGEVQGDCRLPPGGRREMDVADNTCRLRRQRD